MFNRRPIVSIIVCFVGDCLQQLKVSEKPIGIATSADVTSIPEQDNVDICTIEAPGDGAYVDITSPDLSAPERIIILKDRFEALVMNTSTYLAKKEATVPRFLASFRRRVTLFTDERQLFPRAFSERNCAKILKAKSVDMVLANFSNFWSFINYQLLQKVIKKFGDSTLRTEMAAYVRDFQWFCSITYISDYPAWSENPPQDFSTVVARLRIEAEHCTVAHLLEYRQKIAASADLQPTDFEPTGALPGSVILKLSLPRVLTSLFVESFNWKNNFAEDIDELIVDGIQLEEYQRLLKVFSVFNICPSL